jgi:hypothetical protein
MTTANHPFLCFTARCCYVRRTSNLSLSFPTPRWALRRLTGFYSSIPAGITLLFARWPKRITKPGPKALLNDSCTSSLASCCWSSFTFSFKIAPLACNLFRDTETHGTPCAGLQCFLAYSAITVITTSICAYNISLHDKGLNIWQYNGICNRTVKIPRTTPFGPGSATLPPSYLLASIAIRPSRSRSHACGMASDLLMSLFHIVRHQQAIMTHLQITSTGIGQCELHSPILRILCRPAEHHPLGAN